MTYPRRWHHPATAPTEPEHRQAMRQHTLTLPNTAASVSLARRTAQMAFTTWGLPTTSTVDAALLITTELVANTVRHAARSPQLDLTITLEADRLTVAVHDDDPVLPPWPPTATTPGGLRVLANLVHHCGGQLELRPDFAGRGKTVRAALPRTPS
ncbi:ATP-binding protein [Streptacidiphilus sp. EB103A]|uniref:ATP-binding protein n=1 Tax=Streptacidiphilus sp. EB103A TaxID=3156275 RepID=UPI003511930F